MNFKRVVSTVLSVTLMASLLNGFAIPAYASGDDVIAIEASRLPEENLVTDSVVYMGTSATNLNEADATYAITVYRDGDVSGEASVEVKTHDLTAVYGKDYELYENDVEVTGDGISILEKNSKQQADEEEEEAVVYYEEPFEDMQGPFAYSNLDNSEEKSSLALLKEAQTGEETRETYPTEFKGLSDSIMQSLAPELGNIMESSSSMILNFAPGETEKVIKFRILDDSDSEGNEGFTITLNNPEGTSVYGVTATAVTITDDEPVVHSTVSFSDSEYNAEDGKVEITVIREGAQYSVSDVLFRTSGDSATAGENYIEQNSIIAFMPYETEKTVEMSVSGEGRFDVFLSEFKGCDEGEYTRATVNISNDGEFELFEEDTKSFDIGISDKTYSVEYEMNQPTGTILDTGYDPALEVGTYYFSSDSGHGGIFSYSKDQYGGSKPWGCGVRESKYVYKSDSDMSQNYGSLKYYHTSTWKNGYTYTESTSTIPGVYYQYIIPDWRETSSFGSAAGVNPQQSRFELFDGSTSIGKNSVMGSFSRSQNKGAVKLEKQNKNLTAKVYAMDDDGSKTPKSYVEFYGLAAMYKKYTISVETPDEKGYISGSGKFSAIPAQVKTASGAQVPYQEGKRDIYVNTNEDNSNIVFEITDGDVNGVKDKFGTLTGYKITIDPGKSEEKTELNYPANYLTFLDSGTHSAALDYKTETVNKIKSRVKSDLRRIPVDKYFVDWIDSEQKKTVSSGHGYYQILKFKPVFDYNNVSVQVVDAVGGSAAFNNSKLTSGSTVPYHAGDSIDLSATAASAGQHVEGYEVSTDGGVNFNLITDTSTLLLRPDTKYIVRPRVADNDNRIEIQFESEEAKKRLHITNLIDQSKLKDDLAGRYILNLNPNESVVEKMMAPEPGSVYNLQILVDQDENSDYIYRPVIKTALDENTYKTQYFDVVAKSKMADNIIKLDVEKVAKSDLTYFSVTGSVISDFKPIRTIGTATASFPVTGYNLFAGGEQEEFYNSKTGNINQFINRVSASTDDNGKYRLEGIYAKNGDTITVLATNGSNSQICAVTLSSDGLKAEDISHSYNEIDEENKTNTMKTEMVKGYVVAQEGIKLAYPSNAPYVASIMYNYNKSENTAKVRLTDNTVRMFDDTLNITAVVNPMGRKISKAIFTAYTVTGKKTEFTAPADENNPGIFIVSIEKMLDTLHNGDKIYVRLVDEECNTVSNTYYDEVLEEEVTTTNEIPIEYPDVDTGLMTYVENELIAPQTYEFTTTPTVNIPLMGNMKGNASSGIISFTRTNWDGNTGYTLTLNLDGAYTTGKTLSTPDKLNNFKKFKNGVSEIESMRKEAVGAVEDVYNASCERAILEANNCDTAFGAGSGDGLRDAAATLEKEKKEVTKAMNNRAAKNKDKAVAGFNRSTLSIDAMFMLMFEFVYNPVKNDYILSCGSVCIGGTMSYSKVMYTTIYGVPVYLQIGGSLQVDFPVSYTTEKGQNALTSGDFNTYAGNIAERLSRDTTGGMEVMLSAKVQAGVGMCGVIGARGYINLSLQTSIIGDSDGLTKESGVLFSTTGGIGIDLLITSIDINLFSVLVGTGAYSNKTSYDFFGGLVSAGSKGKIASYSASDEYELLSVKEDGTVVGKHDYFAGNDDMSSFGKNDGLTLMGMPEIQNINVLLDNAAERTRPQLVDLGQERKMLVFMGSDANADEYNKARLMYSVQNNGEWSTPKIVSDDETVDSTPEVLKKDNKVYIAWADASRKLTEEDSLKDKLITFGISMAVYDVEEDTMGSEITLTYDGYFNLSPQLNVVGDKMYCNYMKRDLTDAENEEDLLDMTNLYSTMAYRCYDFDTNTIEDEKYISIKHSELTDPLVLDYNEVTTQAGGANYMLSTYTVDEDMNFMTDGDREVFLEIYNIDDDKSYYPIKLSDDYVSQSVPKLTDIDGTIILTWIEDGYLFEMMNVTDLINALTDSSNTHNAYINSDSDDAQWYKRTASELGMSYENYIDSIYSDLCFDDFYVYETNFKGKDEQRTAISSYKLVSDGDDLYVFYTDFGDEHSDLTGVELYGAKFKRYQDDGSNEQEDQEWGWSDSVKITDSGKVIDEFDLFIDANEHIHAVSNFYEQSIDANGKITYSPNQLVTIDFGIVNSLDVENFDLSSSLIPGEKSEIVFDVANNGLLTANGFDVTVSAVKDGAETVIYTDSSEEIIETGESTQLNILWDVPEDISDTKIKVVVSEKDVDGGEIVFEEDVPNESKLEFSGNSVTWSESTPHFTTTVKNKGSIASEAYECRVIKNDDSEKEYFTFTVDSLAPGETREYTQAFEIVPEDFNEKGIIPIKATAYKGEEAVAYTVTDIVVSEPVVAQINNGEETLEMTYGKSSQLSVAVAPWSEIAGDAVYYSSDVNVANVNQQGEVYAAGNGSAKIVVFYPSENVYDEIEVSVSGASEPTAKPSPTPTAEPTKKPSSGGSSGHSIASRTPNPTEMPKATESPRPTETPEATESPKPTEKKLPFEDVAMDQWYYESILSVYEKGLMSGITDTLFEPDMDITRGMFVTVLHRMEGEPAANTQYTFEDVDADAYYADAVAWASENGIISGFSETEFRPDGNITREQMTRILLGYYTYKGEGPEGAWAIRLDYTDLDKISDWAMDSVMFCTMKGIVEGNDDGSFNPQGNTTRAQAAVVMEKINDAV